MCGVVRKQVWLIVDLTMEAVGQGADGLVTRPRAASACGLSSEERLGSAEIA